MSVGIFLAGINLKFLLDSEAQRREYIKKKSDALPTVNTFKRKQSTFIVNALSNR